MMSWGSTRFLLEQIDHGKDGFSGFASVLLAVVVDIIVAVTCLVWLVALTALVLEALNTIYAWYGIPEFDWKSQIELARNYPLSKGIMVTGMLGTTLLPTVIHMTLGLGHAMTVWSPPAQKTAGLIDDDMPVSARQAVARVMLYRKLWMLPAFALVCLLCWGLFSAFSAWVKPIGLLLEQVALHSSGLISGL